MATQEFNYEYLRPPSKAQFISHPAEYIMTVEEGEHKRKIFHLVDWMEYDAYEKQALEAFKKHLTAEGHDIIYEDALYVRFLYSGAFDLKECTRRLQVYDEWQRNPNIQNLSPRARTLLENGSLYTYGRDPKYRPIIFLNVAQGDFNAVRALLIKFSIEDYYCAFNHLLKPVMEYMFIPGRIENWIMVIDTGGKMFLPLTSLEVIVKKLGVVYSSCLQKLYVINANFMIKFAYGAAKQFIHPQTQKKIDVLSESQMGKMLESIAADQLEIKYGGVLPNLTRYWPIQTTKNYAGEDQLQRRRMLAEFSSTAPDQEQSVYYSVVNDEAYFGGARHVNHPNHPNHQTHVPQINTQQQCCCQSDSCVLF